MVGARNGAVTYHCSCVRCDKYVFFVLALISDGYADASKKELFINFNLIEERCCCKTSDYSIIILCMFMHKMNII